MELSHRTPRSPGKLIQCRAGRGLGHERKQRDKSDSLSTMWGRSHLSAALLISDSAPDDAINKVRNKYSVSASLVLAACVCSAAEQSWPPFSSRYPNGSAIKVAKKTAPVTPLVCARSAGAANLSDSMSWQKSLEGNNKGPEHVLPSMSLPTMGTSQYLHLPPHPPPTGAKCPAGPMC